MNWPALILSFIGGLAISFVNFLITRSLLKKESSQTWMASVRTIVFVVFFLVLYFIATALSLDLMPFLVAGAIGATIGLIVFSVYLMQSKDKK